MRAPHSFGTRDTRGGARLGARPRAARRRRRHSAVFRRSRGFRPARTPGSRDLFPASAGASGELRLADKPPPRLCCRLSIWRVPRPGFRVVTDHDVSLAWMHRRSRPRKSALDVLWIGPRKDTRWCHAGTARTNNAQFPQSPVMWPAWRSSRSVSTEIGPSEISNVSSTSKAYRRGVSNRGTSE